MMLWAMLVFLISRQISVWWTDTPVMTTDKSMPLYVTKDHALSEPGLEKLRSELLKLVPTEQQLNVDAFSNTRGFVLKFNREGLMKLRDPNFMNGTYYCVHPFLDLVLVDPESNAFVLNLLLVPPSEKSGDAAVGIHLDNTIALDSSRPHLAHAVSVLYLTVPEDMDGGELLLWRHDGKRLGDGKFSFKKEEVEKVHPPDARLIPRENMLTVFRGDAYHRVNSWRHDSAAAEDDEESTEPVSANIRMSVVLEAYRVAPRLYSSTIEFEVNQNHDHRVYEHVVRGWLKAFNEFSRLLVTAMLIFGGLKSLSDVFTKFSGGTAKTDGTPAPAASASQPAPAAAAACKPKTQQSQPKRTGRSAKKAS